MLKYTISLIIVWFGLIGLAQTPQPPAKDSLSTVKKPVYVRFGFDIGKYLWAKLQNNSSYDAYLDAKFYDEYRLKLAAGQETHLTDNNLLNYTTKGHYYKIGVNYNLYRNWLDMNNDVTIGLNYAWANYNYHLHSYRINQPGAVYPPETVIVNQDFNNNSAQWLELETQVQVETFKHVFLGYAVAVKYLTGHSAIDNFDTTYIPGFFNKNTYSNFGFGMQYFISYQVQF
ncbi:MAG TPA: hypothetical protein ENK64_01980 [Flavobacteriales bacterium]|nr:hypothetical protein [Flavobacteriales bacterium]